MSHLYVDFYNLYDSNSFSFHHVMSFVHDASSASLNCSLAWNFYRAELCFAYVLISIRSETAQKC